MLAPLLAMGAIVLLTVIFREMASEVADSGKPQIRGRRLLVKQILLWMVQLLGPTGVVTLGVVALMIAGIWFTVRARTPPIILQLEQQC